MDSLGDRCLLVFQTIVQQTRGRQQENSSDTENSPLVLLPVSSISESSSANGSSVFASSSPLSPAQSPSHRSGIAPYKESTREDSEARAILEAPSGSDSGAPTPRKFDRQRLSISKFPPLGFPDLLDTMEVRKWILRDGLPRGASAKDVNCLRSRVWKVLLDVPCIFDAERYMRHLQQCPSDFDGKIRDDTFRTFKNSTDFWTKVKEVDLIRILNVISLEFGYVQGMNVLLGPFAYVMSELESFYCFHTLLCKHIRQYVLKNLDGVHIGVRLFERCLQCCDPVLHAYLLRRIPDLKIFALRYILTLMANTQPLSEVLRLWDAIFAFGMHFNILLLCSLLMLHRKSILSEKRGSKIILLLEDTMINSELLIAGALSLVQFIPLPLFEEMVRHPMIPQNSV